MVFLVEAHTSLSVCLLPDIIGKASITCWERMRNKLLTVLPVLWDTLPSRPLKLLLYSTTGTKTFGLNSCKSNNMCRLWDVTECFCYWCVWPQAVSPDFTNTESYITFDESSSVNMFDLPLWVRTCNFPIRLTNYKLVDCRCLPSRTFTYSCCFKSEKGGHF